MNKVLPALLRHLGLLVLSRTPSNAFECLSQVPDWFAEGLDSVTPGLSRASLIDTQSLGQAFPFIENFLHDAEHVWRDQSTPQAESGLWTEVDPLGKEFQLEARAITLEGQHLLLIENVSHSFQERHTVYQKARDIALLNEKLIAELSFRQRKLQSDIEKHLLQQQPIDDLSDSVDRNPSAVLVCQPDGDVELYNRALVNIYEVDETNNAAGRSILDKWIVEAEQQHPEVSRTLKSGSYWEGEFETSDTKGDKKWIRLCIGPVKNGLGEISHFVCIANDLSDYRRMADDWGSISDYDYNTHLPNRRQFWKHITALLETEKNTDENIALLYVDLDYFKRINDEHGHFAGDFLLGTMASRLSRNIKHGDYIAHLGGDEFVILLRFIQSEDDVISIGERILVTIGEPINLDGTPLRVSASIGVVLSPIVDTDAHSLLKNADLAMYSAKELGRAQVRLYTPELETNMPKRSQREHELLIAIEQQQFVLEYQPQIALCPEHAPRVEALIRWEHPRLGRLAPGEFIGIAEETGSVVPIGDWVLASACAQGKRWADNGHPTHIAVNISVKQLKHPDFLSKLTEILNRTRFSPMLLELEITESSFLEEMEQAIRVLNQARSMGIQVALDDFGSGFSSLNYLKHLPVDFLKIDRSFIHDLPEDIQSRAITTSVIHLAHKLNMKVIAEGVENPQQLDFLKNNAVDFAQGYLFFKPMDSSLLEQVDWSLPPQK
ncbi:MAG: EAL domain-containing protein [Oleiphilaceae bacterium]|nr:EAL domain-containing protein [Oleiphilaceae bacterium]